MSKLLRLEWSKSSPFRKTTMILMGLAFLFNFLVGKIESLNTINLVITLGMVFASFGLTFIGSLLYLKDDFDQKAPFNLIVPLNSFKIVMSKILVFMSNFIIVICFGLLLLNVSMYINSPIYKSFYNESQNILSYLNIKSIIMFFISFSLRLAEIFLYSSLALLSILFIRSLQKKTGNIKWLLLTILLIFVIFLINQLLNQILPISLNLDNLQLVNLSSLVPTEDLNLLNRFFIFPSICDQILVHAPLNLSTISSMIMILPFILMVCFSVVSVKLSMYLIDKKIDF